MDLYEAIPELRQPSLELASERMASSSAFSRESIDPRHLVVGLRSMPDLSASSGPLDAAAFAIGQSATHSSREQSLSLSLIQVWKGIQATVDLNELARQLAMLRQALQEQVKSAEGAVVLGEVAHAEIEASRGNGPSVLKHLREAGIVALEAAHKSGFLLASEAAQAALRL
jgi:hypothetical protein